MDYKQFLEAVPIYAAGFATYAFYSEKRGRIKITYDCMENCYIADGLLTTFYLFTIVNMSSRKRTLTSIGYEFNNDNDTGFSPRPRRYYTSKPMEFGDQFEYEVYYSDFDNIFEYIDADKFRLVVRDTTGKVYHSEWLKNKAYSKPARKLGISDFGAKVRDYFAA